MVGREYPEDGPRYKKKICSFDNLIEAVRWLEGKELPAAIKGDSPCAGGETVEAALNKDADNNPLDFKFEEGKTKKAELKVDRQRITCPTTLASRSLDSWTGKPYSGKTRKERFDHFVRKFAYQSERPEGGFRENLHMRLGTDRKDAKGLKDSGGEVGKEADGLHVKLCNSRLWVCDRDDNKLLFYDQEDLDFVWYKIKLQIHLEIKTIEKEERVFYKVVSANRLDIKIDKLTPRKLFNLIKKKAIHLEIMAHICNETCQKDGKLPGGCGTAGYVRDHCTALRIDKKKKDEIFNLKKVIF